MTGSLYRNNPSSQFIVYDPSSYYALATEVPTEKFPHIKRCAFDYHVQYVECGFPRVISRMNEVAALERYLLSRINGRQMASGIDSPSAGHSWLNAMKICILSQADVVASLIMDHAKKFGRYFYLPLATYRKCEQIRSLSAADRGHGSNASNSDEDARNMRQDLNAAEVWTMLLIDCLIGTIFGYWIRVNISSIACRLDAWQVRMMHCWSSDVTVFLDRCTCCRMLLK